MPQVTPTPTRGRLIKEPKLHARHEVTFALSGQWLPEVGSKEIFSGTESPKFQALGSDDPEFHELLGELLNSPDVDHVRVEQLNTRANFFVQLKADLSCEPLRGKAKIGQIVGVRRA